MLSINGDLMVLKIQRISARIQIKHFADLLCFRHLKINFNNKMKHISRLKDFKNFRSSKIIFFVYGLIIIT